MFRTALAAAFLALLSLSCVASRPQRSEAFILTCDTPVDPALQAKLESIDATLRGRFEMSAEQADTGVLDLRTMRLANSNSSRGWPDATFTSSANGEPGEIGCTTPQS